MSLSLSSLTAQSLFPTQNPDTRVSILIAYARQHFGFDCKMLNYALEVEKITTAKKGNLILNVDGCIASLFTGISFLLVFAFSLSHIILCRPGSREWAV